MARPGPRTLAVRQSLGAFLDRAGLQAGDPVVCGVSGGGDSLALTAAAVHAGLAVTTVTVDHGLQEGSDRVAAEAAATCRRLGAQAQITAVTVRGTGEAPARQARYRALGEAAAGRPLLVGHTADDDAEGLLIALSRGSGTGSLAGLREIATGHPAVVAGAGWLGRPLLHARRADTRGSCAELGLDIWDDPHNERPDILRSRVRGELLPAMREVLGTGVDAALSRSARLMREDADVLDALAAQVLQGLQGPQQDAGLPAGQLAGHPGPVRRRVLRQWLAGEAGPLTSAHLAMLEALVVDWHGQGPVAVPWPTGHTMGASSGTTRLVVRRHRGLLVLDQLRSQD